MTSRRSIEVAGLSHHGLPIPTGSRIGPLIASGGIRGVDRSTGNMPNDLAQQASLMFDNVRAIVEAGGGSCETIFKMTIWTTRPEAREAVNIEWIKMFPDAASRPARHILNYDLPGGMLVQCEVMAVAAEQAGK